MRCCAIVFALLLTALAWPLDQSDVLFYAPFDGTVTPALALGGKTPQTDGQPTFQAGRRGQAVVCQDKQFSLAYPAAGNLDPRHGSLSLWVAPVAWRHGDGRAVIPARAAPLAAPVAPRPTRTRGGRCGWRTAIAPWSTR